MIKKQDRKRGLVKAERQGFEPWVGFTRQPLSRRSQSSTLAPPQIIRLLSQAEEVGFEPTIGFPIPVFKTGALGRSAIPP